MSNGAQNQAEMDKMRRQNEKCTDPNCFDQKVCKRSHDHKSTTKKVCTFFLRNACGYGRECFNSHNVVPKNNDEETATMEVDDGVHEEIITDGA